MGHALMEVQIVELSNMSTAEEVMKVQFRQNLWRHTNTRSEYDRYCDYMKSPRYVEFLHQVCWHVKQNDSKKRVNLQKRPGTPDINKTEQERKNQAASGKKKTKQAPAKKEEELISGPSIGDEFNFSNILVRVYQLPMLFIESSEFDSKPHEGCFLIMLYERKLNDRMCQRVLLEHSKAE